MFMCLRPITIYNPTKYISLCHGDAFQLTVPCGHCAECQSRKSDEWYFRSFYHMKSCLESGGSILFDTLTYDDSHLPMMSSVLGLDLVHDYPCFRRSDIRSFFVRLRRYCTYHSICSRFTYFLSSEYGELRHRPHYHVLFYLPKGVNHLDFARAVYLCWNKGRTDVWSNIMDNGVGYLNQRVFNDISAHGMRLANYVSKYVQKYSAFDKVISARIMDVVDTLIPLSDFDSELARRSLRIKLYHESSQFHLQSKGYGLAYLDDVDMSSLFATGMCNMVVPKANILKHIPLPMYYYRHLFQEQVIVDGKRVWQNTELGRSYRLSLRPRLLQNFVDRLHAWRLNIAILPCYNDIKYLLDFDDYDFANYVLFKRARYKDADYSSLESRLHSLDFIHYGSDNDKLVYGKKFVTSHWLGNDVLGYDSIVEPIARKSFLYNYTIMDPNLEKVYNVYLLTCGLLSCHKQDSYDYKQRLERLYKVLTEKS